jgi:hypothetical protein
MDALIVLIVGIVLIASIYRGIVRTFKRQPVVAALTLIFLTPIYVIWAIVEVIMSIFEGAAAADKDTN